MDKRIMRVLTMPLSPGAKVLWTWLWAVGPQECAVWKMARSISRSEPVTFDNILELEAHGLLRVTRRAASGVAHKYEAVSERT